MPGERYERARGDAGKVFGSPDAIVRASDLSRAEKIELLQEWERDLHGVIVAAGEGMTLDQPDHAGLAGEHLREITAALRELGVPEAHTSGEASGV
jgi:hypothetical protein